MLCGRPNDPDPDKRFEGFPAEELNQAFSGIAAPDNITFDDQGNLWIATDGQPSSSRLGLNDGLFAVPVEGEHRGHIGQFFSGVKDCEVCGPEFTPDNKTLFLAIQHPGDSGDFTAPGTRWPDFDSGIPPRPSVIAIRAVSTDGQIGVEKVGQLTMPYRTHLPLITTEG
jgi:secreted PhoX family phosphatase